MEKSIKATHTQMEINENAVNSKNIKKRNIPKEKQCNVEEWLAHEKAFERLAQPKKLFEPPPVVRKKVPLDKLLPRIAQLAQPRLRAHEHMEPPVFGMKA